MIIEYFFAPAIKFRSCWLLVFLPWCLINWPILQNFKSSVGSFIDSIEWKLAYVWQKNLSCSKRTKYIQRLIRAPSDCSFNPFDLKCLPYLQICCSLDNSVFFWQALRLCVVSVFSTYLCYSPILMLFSSVFLIEDVFTDDSSMKLVLKMKRKSSFISFPCFNWLFDGGL